MSSDADFFRRLFEKPSEGNSEDDFSNFAEWLDDGDETVIEFVSRRNEERRRKDFDDRVNKKKKKKR